MAFIDPTQDPENPDENQSQVDQALQGTQNQLDKSDSTILPPVNSGGGGGDGIVSSGTAASSAAPTGSGKPTSSGSWVNLNSYLDANKDQGAQVGQTIAGTVEDLGNKAQTSIDTLGTNFNAAVQNNSVKQDQDAVNNAISGAQGLKAGQSLDDNTFNAFQAQKNATYGGPTDVTGFDGYTDAQKNVNTASTAVGQTGSEAGRNVLLQNQYKNSSVNGYNQGENNLDQLLLENSPGAQEALHPLQSKWANLSNALGTTVSTGNAAAQTGAQSTAQTAQSAAKAAADAQAAYEASLNQTTQDQWAKTQELINQYKGQPLANNMTPEQLAASGLTLGQKVYNTNLQNYVNQSTPTAATNANLDQYAQDAALSKLAGVNGMLQDTSLAGTANMGMFDKSLAPALKDADDQYQKNYNSPGTQIPLMKMPDGSMQDINHFFGDMGANGVSVVSGPMQAIAKRLGGLPQGASPADLETKWLPALQEEAARWPGNNKLETTMIDAIQKALATAKENQGFNKVIAPPALTGTQTIAHPRSPRR